MIIKAADFVQKATFFWNSEPLKCNDYWALPNKKLFETESEDVSGEVAVAKLKHDVISKFERKMFSMCIHRLI